MAPEAEGYFVLCGPAGGEGLPYAFRLADGREYPDPASRWQPDGRSPSLGRVLSRSRTAGPTSDWRGVAREDLVIYELHVGAFTPEGTLRRRSCPACRNWPRWA